MSLIDNHLLVKLETPQGAQTYVGDTIQFKFWILNPADGSVMQRENFEFEILCQEVIPSPSASYLGTFEEAVIYSSQDKLSLFNQLQMVELNFKEGEIYRSPDGVLEGPTLEVSGELLRKESFKGTFVLKIKVFCKGVYITSNSVSLTLGTREDFSGKFLGGPLVPVPENHFDRTLILRGWATYLGTEIESVEVSVPHCAFFSVKHGLEFADLTKSLPDLSEIRSAGIELVCIFKDNLVNEQVLFNLKVRFKSGEFSDYYWGSTLVSTTSTRTSLGSQVKERLSRICRVTNLLKDKSNKVLFVTHNLSLTEGAPKIFYSVMQSIAKRFSSDLLSLRDGDAREEYADLFNCIHLVPDAGQIDFTLERYCAGVKKIDAVLENENFSLVVANGLDSFPVVAQAIAHGLKTIWIIHESIDPGHWYDRMPINVRHIFLFALYHTQKLVFVSEKTRDLYLPYVKNNASTVIRNGIDVEGFYSSVRKIDRDMQRIRLSIRPEEFVFITVGTTTERKGQDRTIRELSILKRKNPELKFKMYFIGAREIPFLWSMRQLIVKLGIEKEVFFIPETSDVAKYYAIADCFIINSREESSPLVALEAFSAGLPIVSTTVFGLADLILDGKTGLSFDGDTEGELAEVLLKIVGDPSLRDSLSSGGAKFVRENFTLQRMVREYESLIEVSLEVSPRRS